MKILGYKPDWKLAAVGIALFAGSWWLKRHTATGGGIQIPMPIMPMTMPTDADMAPPLPPGMQYGAPVAIPHLDPITSEAVPADDPFPRQMPEIAIEYIANNAVHELGSNASFTTEERDNLYEVLMANYYNELAEIAQENDYRLSPLTGKPLATYSALLLMVSQNHAVPLSPSSRAVHRAQTFSVPEDAMDYGVAESFVALS